MSIADSSGVRAAVTAAQAPASDAVQMLVLKKALDAQARGAATLIAALPQPVAPSGSAGGTSGGHVDTFA